LCYIVNNTINSVYKVLFVGSMKLTVVIVTLILMTLVDEGATCGSWRAPRIRVPPILKKVCNPVCTTTCVYVTECLRCRPVCSYGCHKTVCTRIGRKRSEPQVIISLSYSYKKNHHIYSTSIIVYSKSMPN
jgi:hypothetical protein